MQRLPLHRRKINVSFFSRLAAINKAGYCPARITVRWHNQELLLDTGEHVLPEKTGKKGKAVPLWGKVTWRVTRKLDRRYAVHLSE
ncbi:hypothetical protein LJ737_04445 [Hymenobacter sp. 15J16-1T3B]|uniref:hypothetical protein n=1 Tax=Hymenobacter sp. 15J16-1T3B TaxID=2886941 RepID=UPI001D12D200|nr:hypothetical protein [Hymenobacter sp. 15J16-1T3B]MCC3156473.1 hypothetical protein [Hymenobacter sp. 15J16-1T3B]